VVGGCDLYITKAAGGDKKLYAKIESDLQAQHQSLLRLAASLSPPQAAQFANSSNLSRSSPFGTLNEISNRRVFAYLIATLNASHPDYDFSHILRPTDFVRERRLTDVMRNIDEKILSAHGRSTFRHGPTTPGGSTMWSPEMWNLIDEEMDLPNCATFSYQPEDNPFDDDEPAIWSLHYLFFNKRKKRVCYMYLRALKISYYEYTGEFQTPKRKYSARDSVDFSGAGKRATYWLGDRASGLGDFNEDEVITAPGDDEVDADVDPDWLDEIVRTGRSLSPISVYSNDDEEDSREFLQPRERRKSNVRAVSEGVAEAMEV
jgi:Maf1 regulator